MNPSVFFRLIAFVLVVAVSVTLVPTGVIYAVQDGPIHVSVRPIGATMEDWIKAGSSSIWTQAVKSVVIKWDGGYLAW